MSDYTPSLDQVRGRYCGGTLVQTGRLTDGHEFDRMIAKVRADAKAEALREAADTLNAHAEKNEREAVKLAFRTKLNLSGTYAHVRHNRILARWLRARADKLDTL